MISLWGSNRKWMPNDFYASCKLAWKSSGFSFTLRKTRLIEFGRYAAKRREKRGDGKPETFNFLGFTHCCCGNTREGRLHDQTQDDRQSELRAKLLEIKQQLRFRMHGKVS